MLQVRVRLKMEQPICRARVEFYPRPEKEMADFEKLLLSCQQDMVELASLAAHLENDKRPVTIEETPGKLRLTRDIIPETIYSAVAIEPGKTGRSFKFSNLEAIKYLEEKFEGYKEFAREILDLAVETGGKSLFYRPAVVWESAEGSIQLGKEFTDEIVALALEAAAGKYLEYGSLAEKLAGFYNKWGPLFKEKTVSEDVIRHRLILLAWSAICWRYSDQIDYKILDHILMKPLEEAKKAWLECDDLSRLEGFVLHGYLSGKFSFAPVEKGKKIVGGYLVLLPAEFPDRKRKERVVSWLRNIVLKSVRRILNSVEYRTYADRKGNLQLTAQPKDAYSLALLRIIWGDGSGLKKCACGCGLYTPHKWYHPSHARRGKVLDNEKSYWRLQKNRGKFTEKDYKLIEAEIERLWDKGIQKKDRLREKIKLFTKKFPRP
ncbi:MAG: hypothetical protein AB1523_12375 [Bacillota bacterium]